MDVSLGAEALKLIEIVSNTLPVGPLPD